MRAMARQVVERCIEHIASAATQPSCGDVDAAALCRAMREPAPERGAPLDSLLDELFREWVPRSFTTPLVPATSRSFRAAACFRRRSPTSSPNTTNRFTGVWQAAPALVQLEANALDWLREWMGFPPDTRGLFTTGGSMATFNAIVCARERHLGADIRPRRPVHVRSGAPLGAEVGEARRRHAGPRARDRVRRSLPAPRRRAGARPIAEDRRAGLDAVCRRVERGNDEYRCGRSARRDRRRLRASKGCGTTSTAPTARSSISATRCAACSRGLPRADSLTLDPHKGMFLPYGTGALLVRDGAALRAAHEATAAYLPAMPHPEDFYDPSQHGPELSRGLSRAARLAVA